MQCPRCHIPLEKIHNEFLEECPTCHGAWYGSGELRRSKDAEDRDLIWNDFEFWRHEDRFRPSACPFGCPACGAPLVTLAYGDTGVEIDACPACRGIWLDAGEFERIIAALEHEVSARSLGDYARDALAEARELIGGPEGVVSEWRDFRAILRLMTLRLFVEKPGLVKALVALQGNSPLK